MGAQAQFRAMAFAARGRVVSRYVGQLCVVQAALMSPPVAVGLATGSGRYALWGSVSIAAVLGVGLLLRRLGVAGDVQPNEALVVTASAFLISPLILTFSMAGFGLAPIDALFETVSAITTTGLSTIASREGLPPAFFFLRAWMQWYGGLGIVVLSVALVVEPGAALRRLSASQSSVDDVAGGIRANARRVLRVYLVLTAVGLAVVLAAGAGPWTGLLHTLAAVSTGGFSTFAHSLGGLPNGWARAAVMAVSLAGAVGLPVYYRLAERRFGAVARDGELRLLGILVVLLAAALAGLMLLEGHTWRQAVGHAAVTSVSAQTTAGFYTLEPRQLPAAGKLLVIFSMAVGGSQGSTAGGIKVLRLLIILRSLQALFHRVTLPGHAVAVPRIQGERLEPSAALERLLVVWLFAAVIAASWLVFVAAGYDPLDSLFDVVSATGTVGLSTGVAGSELPAGLKLLLCVGMIAGRVEVLALAVLVYPRTWIGRRRRPS